MIIATFLKANPCEFSITAEQLEKLNICLGEQFEQLTTTHGSEASSIVCRMSIIVFRIAMILSSFRRWELEDKEQKLICREIDFDCALKLGEVYLAHAATMLELTPKSEARMILSQKEEYLNKLTDAFARKEAIDLANKMGISERTAARWIKEFVNKEQLIQKKFGHYEKVKKEN